MNNLFFDQMLEESKKVTICLSDRQFEQFYMYYELLIEWNKLMNLTAITDMSGVITKHFIDSIAVVKAIPEQLENGCNLIDIGTGAGFPGIPLKIVYPELDITLLDSLNKRILFLDEVISRLDLIGINTIHGRAEDFGRNVCYREKYDICVSRAVANIATLAEYSLPFVREGGLFVSYKSGSIQDELMLGDRAIKMLGGKLEDKVLFSLNSDGIDRSFIMIRKVKATKSKYPRRAGLPSKEPLR